MSIRSFLRTIYWWGTKKCPACGRRSRLRFSSVMWPELGAEWGLDDRWYRWFDLREGKTCAKCRSNLRSRQLASVIVSELNGTLGTRHTNLRELCLDARAHSLAVAEINQAGGLHPWLQSLPGLSYSEYGSQASGVRSEDLGSLSYASDSFDLVLTSDTLEHVPDFDRALAEIRRVLKPDGMHIFTVPVVWNRATRNRNDLPPSYHGSPKDRSQGLKVVHEFGADVVDRIRGAGFELALIQDLRNPTLTTFVARKAG